MARKSFEATIDTLTNDENVKIVVLGFGAATAGRANHIMRLRPSLMSRLAALSSGPAYLLVEHALERLLADLEALPQGQMTVLKASSLDASQADFDLISERRKSSEPDASL